MARKGMLKIKLSGAYRIDRRLDALLDALMPIYMLDRPKRICFDLEGLVAVSPSALALLTATIADADERGVVADDSQLLPPRSWQVRNYLMRMDMLKLVVGHEVYAEHVHEPFERKKTVGFRPCQEFQSLEDFPPVTSGLADALAESCITEDVARRSIRVCLDELAENVIHHADAPLGGFAAAQGWKRSGTFEIAIVDLGIGIRGSLTKNPEYADIGDDVTAISRALQPRVTSTPERNSGIGLFITKLLLRENGGFFLIRSGNGAVYAGSKEEAVTTRTVFPGTLVALRARTDRPLDIKHVYRRLTEHDDDADSEEADDDQAG